MRGERVGRVERKLGGRLGREGGGEERPLLPRVAAVVDWGSRSEKGPEKEREKET